MPSGPPYDNGSNGAGALSRGASIGRYVVLGLVGRGGMGEVYAAYDPELDRKVAVKLLRVNPGNGVSLTEGRQRTLREAQAIARLSHPNVVVVYDVGTFLDQVFIAMEFVDGNTVSYWLQVQPRSCQEILKVFLAAGRGLMAAHDKGLVHRDFKPDNVMVGRDGGVRVMDFGLARQMNDSGPASELSPLPAVPLPRAAAGEGRPAVDAFTTMVLHGPPAPQQPDAITTSSGSGAFEMQLTRTGAMMGTPAYMAPEQFLGKPTDARTDQFSFCVALYEALYGQRPFAGDSIFALTGNVVQGKVADPPAGTKVPPWIRRVLLRGLRSVAAERYPSMNELLAALEKDPAIERRRWAIAAAALLLPLAVGFGVRQSLARDQSMCGGAEERLAGAWDLAAGGASSAGESPRQAAIRRSFLATGKTYAGDAYATVDRLLTRYARSWAGMYREACEATHVRGEQSAEVLDLRMSCLQERLGGLRALTQVFSDATGEVVENAVSAANALGTLDRCADVPLLRAVVRPPEDPATRARVEELRQQVAELKALYDAGRWQEARKKGTPLAARVRALGYQPLIAETLATLGLVQLELAEAGEAERTLEEAFWAADASRHDEVRATASTYLVWVTGYQQGRVVDAQRWARASQAVLARMGGHERLQAWLLNDLGSIHELQGKKEEALRVHQQALHLKEKALGSDDPDVAISEGNLAIVLQDLGRNQAALVHVDRAIAILEKALGSDHPQVATQLSNRGEILNALGRWREARQSFETARVIWERELGLDNRNLAYALTGIGVSLLAETDAASALAPLERAFKIREQHETDPARRADTGFALARALWEANGDRRRAQALAMQAKAAYAQAAASARLAEVDGWLAGHRGAT